MNHANKLKVKNDKLKIQNQGLRFFKTMIHNSRFMILKKLQTIVLFLLLSTLYSLLTFTTPVSAATVNTSVSSEINTNFTNAAAPYTQQNILALIGLIINAVLGILGVVFLVLIIYGGFRWLMARGDETELKKVRSLIEHSIIGLIIVVSSFVIAKFVLAALQKAAF